jgi:hypothetical protein
MAGWTYEELLPNGWHPFWLQDERGDGMVSLDFTFYRSEIARHTVNTVGATESVAIEQAVTLANAWLREYPEFAPKRPPAAAG